MNDPLLLAERRLGLLRSVGGCSLKRLSRYAGRPPDVDGRCIVIAMLISGLNAITTSIVSHVDVDDSARTGLCRRMNCLVILLVWDMMNFVEHS